MAEITITIPDEKLDAVLDALAARFGYQENVDLGNGPEPNPTTKGQFVKGKMIGWIRMSYQEYIAGEAVKNAANELGDIT